MGIARLIIWQLPFSNPNSTQVAATCLASDIQHILFKGLGQNRKLLVNQLSGAVDAKMDNCLTPPLLLGLQF